jgi:two-component system OmpR family sensor kinase
MLPALSLRTRLIVGVIALAAAGFVAADFLTYTSLRSFLVSRTDNALQSAHISVDSALGGDGPLGSARGADGHHDGVGRHLSLSDIAGDISRLTTAAPGVYVQIRRPNGVIVNSGRLAGPGSDAVPRLPATVHYTSSNQAERYAYFTVPAAEGSGETETFRVRASSEAGYVLLVASSLHDVSTTLHRLVLVEAIVTLLVLAAIALLGMWVIRLGLRPLTAIGATAATIASGDLTQRVAREDARTEVGRLGLALNGMLEQIESAFRAREASERKLRRFVADASHELRTPLAAVRAYAELFTRGAADHPEDLARSMKGITRESERMSLLVEDLLLLARLDEGRPLESEPVDLREVVADAVETARAVEPDREITCNLSIASIRGDHDRLRQAVDNLLANVRAHTPHNTAVSVTLTAADAVARLIVQDSGPGMDEEQAAHVFERFYRADSSRARASGGVGLGLSIVAAVVAAHGGGVSASSVQGQGATFVIELPLAPPA